MARNTEDQAATKNSKEIEELNRLITELSKTVSEHMAYTTGQFTAINNKLSHTEEEMAATSIEELTPEIGPTPVSFEEELLAQPFQEDDMSVKVFYEHFCIWKNKMGAFNCDDERYVVDFLYGLKMDLMVRVLRHNEIRRVSDAFSWAKVEEILLSGQETSGQNDANKVFDELPSPESESQNKAAFDQILGVRESEKRANKVLDGTTISAATGSELFHLKYITENENEYPKAQVLPLNPLFDYVPQNFDPGVVSWNILGGIIDRNGINRDFDVMLGKQRAGKMLLFIFDPGGISWFRDNCDSSLFTNDKQHFSKSYGLAESVLAFIRNGNAMLIVLSSWCSGKDSRTVVGVMVVYFGRFLFGITTHKCLAKALVILNLNDIGVHTWRVVVADVQVVKVAKTLNKSAQMFDMGIIPSV